VPGRGYRFLAPVTRVEPAARRAISPPSNSPRLSIVVLPFANLGGDSQDQYFADALTDDLTTDLSPIPDLLVISRNTAFTYRNKPADTRQIGRELRVRYVLEGSVRRLGNHIRINTQLIDAETDTHLWAERFDRDVEDLFALQDEVTRRTAIALKTELVIADATRPIEHLVALDYLLRARAVLRQPWTRDNCAAAVSLLERALAFDPDHCRTLWRRSLHNPICRPSIVRCRPAVC
jgi:TolB-like protein